MSIVGGLLLLDLSVLAVVQAVESVAANPLPLFGVGLGWSLSFDTTTVEAGSSYYPNAESPHPGFNDLLWG